LHKAGYGHGDLAWRNVLSTTDHNFMLIDLESVLKLGTPPDPMPAEGPMAAAVEEDGSFTARSDLYMLGCMLEEADCMDAGCSGLAHALLTKSLSVEGALQHSWLRTA
jgi:hypothetical protein